MILKENGYETKCRQEINNFNCTMDIRQTYNVKYVFNIQVKEKMNKIVILLITIACLFGQWKHQTDPTTIRQLYVLDENHIKHYSQHLEWRTEHQIVLIHNMQLAMRRVNKGNYNQTRSQEIADIIQKYVDIEKQHREDLKVLKKELRELTR